MAPYNPLHQERVYFDEPVKGDHLLITSRIISYRGITINTPSVSQLTRISYTQSVNAIPSAAQFRVIVAAPDAEIKIDFARFGGALWLGKGQFQRVGSAFFAAEGKHLVSTALERLRAGETLVWRHNPSSFEKDSTVRLSRSDIHIQQIGVIFNKDVSIEWSALKFTQVNGSSKFQNYKTREHATINTWRMLDNMTFLGVVGFLVEKANYRILQG
jgi:hypothetical protein